MHQQYLPPYIGVTGFMTREEVDQAITAFHQTKRPDDRHLMIGILASSKTLKGEQNKWGNRFPRVQDISRLVRDRPFMTTLVHYSTDEPETLSEQLQRLQEFGGPFLDGFQLNMVWPDPNAIKEALYDHEHRRPASRIVLQIGSRAFKACAEDHHVLAARIDAYAEIVTDVLFDLSGGHGRPLDIEKSLDVLFTIRLRHPHLGLGVAGGLCADTLPSIERIVAEFPHVSIDAEGRLRDHPDARLNLETVERYIVLAQEKFYA